MLTLLVVLSVLATVLAAGDLIAGRRAAARAARRWELGADAEIAGLVEEWRLAALARRNRAGVRHASAAR